METKADWLRSEIEKLEGERHTLSNDTIQMLGTVAPTAIRETEVYNQALTSIITRYKEELLELEKGV